MAVSTSATSRLTKAVGLGILLTADAGADSWEHRGLLRSRDLTPFGLLRLDMLPSNRVNLPVGGWVIELQLSYQNTFVLSPNVEAYLRDRDTGRISLRAEDAQAIFSLPGDAYYVDGEVGLYDLVLHRRISPRWLAYTSVPYIRYGRGLFDDLVESFHDALGFSQMGRDLVARHRFQFVYRIDDDRVALLDRPTKGGFGDPVFGLRYDWPLPDPDWTLAIEGAIKLALDGQRLLLSTGEHDFGLQATLRRSFGRQALHGSLSAVYFTGSRTPPDDHSQILPTLIVGWSYALTSRSNLIMQGYASRSTIRHSTVRELTDNKYQVSFGWRIRRGHTLFNLAVTENVGNFRNTPDIGVQLGFAYEIPRE